MQRAGTEWGRTSVVSCEVEFPKEGSGTLGSDGEGSAGAGAGANTAGSTAFWMAAPAEVAAAVRAHSRASNVGLQKIVCRI